MLVLKPEIEQVADYKQCAARFTDMADKLPEMTAFFSLAGGAVHAQVHIGYEIERKLHSDELSLSTSVNQTKCGK